MIPTLKAPRYERLKLKCDILLSTYAFNFNLRRYILEGGKDGGGGGGGRGGEGGGGGGGEGEGRSAGEGRAMRPGLAHHHHDSGRSSGGGGGGSPGRGPVDIRNEHGRGLHSFTLELNLSNSSNSRTHS